MSDIAKLGFSVDTTGLKKGETALDSFAKTGETTEKRTDKSSKKIADDFAGVEKAVGKSTAAQLKADKAMANLSRRSGQAGIQFQQFIGQVQGGQGVMLALSQQSADLGFVLGAPLLGAIAGISASLVGLLIPNLIDTTSAMDDLDKAMEQVNQTATDTDGIKAFTKEIALIAEESEKTARLMILAAEQSAREAGRAAAEGIGEEFNDAFDVTTFQASFDALKTIAGTASGTGFSISQEYMELGEQFGLTGVEAREAGVSILVSLREMENAVSSNAPEAGDKIIAFQEKLSDLAETASGENKTKLLTFVNSISEYVSKAKLATEMGELFNDTLKKDNLELVTDETNKFNAATDGVSKSLEAQIVALRDGEDAALNWSIAQRLGLEDGEEIPATIQAQIAALKELKTQQEDDYALMEEIREEEKIWAADRAKEAKEQEALMTQEEKDFESLTKKIEDFGGTWTKTGSVIIDAFGDISDAMDDYAAQLSEIEANEQALAEFRKKKGADNAEVIALQTKLESDRVSAELSGLQSLSKAGESLFEEKTVAAQTFAALSKVLAVAEIALSYQKIAASTTETAVVVSNKTVEAEVNALAAITSAFAAPFPTNFIAGAAMIGIMSELVGGFGGSSSTVTVADIQEDQGTGTVLGDSDAQSESIANGIELIADISGDQLSELETLNTLMGELSDGIDSIGLSIANIDVTDLTISGADLFGESEGVSIESTASSTQDVINALSAGRAFSDAVGVLFESVGTTITEATSVLGLDFEEAIADFTFDDIDISVEGLSSDEQSEAISTVLSAAIDNAVDSIIPSMTYYQEVGEGVYETLIRVTGEQVVFNEAIESMGFNLSDLSSAMQIDIAQSIINLTGDLDEFSEYVDSFVESFFSDAEQFAMLESSITDVFDDLGFAMVSNNDEFRALIESLDLTTESGQNAYVALLSINSEFDEFTDYLEEVAESSLDMLESAIELEEERAAATLEAASDAYDAEIDRLEALSEVLEAENTLREEAYDAEIDRLEALSDALEEENTIREDALSDAEDALNDSFDNEMELIQAIADAKIEAMESASESEIEAIESASEARIESLEEEQAALEETATALESFISSITDATSTDSTSTDLVSALAQARAGDLTAAMNLDISSLTSLESTGFASAEEMAIQSALNANRLSELSDIASEQLSDAELTIAAIESQINATESSAESQIEAIESSTEAETQAIQDLADSEITELEEQLNTLLGIDTSILDLSDAISQYQEAQLAVDELGYSQEVERLEALVDSVDEAYDLNEQFYNEELDRIEMLVDSADEVYALHEQAYDDEIERLDAILEDNEELLNAALGIDTSVLSVADAIEALNASISDLFTDESSTIPTPSQIVKDLVESEDGTPVDTNVMLKDEITKMSEDNAAFQMEIVKNTKSTARILQRIEFDGIPSQEA